MIRQVMFDRIKQAAALLHEGKLVAFPTETVYGLGADAMNEAAVSRIFQVKKRPYNHPVIVHLADINELADWAIDISPFAYQLAKAFWPGPLSILLKKQPHVLDVVTAGAATIGLRMPHHPVAQALLKEFGSGIAAPSANRFTHISPTTAQAVYEELGGAVDLILDGGACEVGLESTIIDLSCEQPIILRPGMITAKAIAEVLNMRLIVTHQDAPVTRAPGMHHVHYAPETKTTILETSEINLFLQALQLEELPIALVVWSSFSAPFPANVHVIPMPTSASSYAHDLYQTLRSLDTGYYKQIVIENTPMHAEWEAIRDRLYKASGSS